MKVTLISVAVIFVINIISYILVWYDKRQAILGGWRIPEKRFFTLALIGGATGIYFGMKKFRHKTKHNLFIYGIPIMIVLNITISIAIIYFYIILFLS